MDEDAWRSHGEPTLRDAFAIRKRYLQEHSEGPAAISIGVRADTTSGSRRHHHAERPVLRTPPRWRPHDRSGAAQADASWSCRETADLHDGRHPALSFGIAHPFPR